MQVRAIIQRALDEDIGWGDVTTDHSVPADQWSRAVLLAKQDGVLCGGRVFAETFAHGRPRRQGRARVPDGARVAKGDVAARIEGPTRALLTAERTALNFVQRLSGIATMTAAFVARLDGLPTQLIDTRKTTPGLRVLGEVRGPRRRRPQPSLQPGRRRAAEGQPPGRPASRGLDLADGRPDHQAARAPHHAGRGRGDLARADRRRPRRRGGHHPARQHVERGHARGRPPDRRARPHRVLRQRHPRDRPRARRDRRRPDLVRRADPLGEGRSTSAWRSKSTEESP